MRTALTAALLLCALPLSAQTVQNANFQAPVTFIAGDGQDQWEAGTVPNWTVTGNAGIQLLARGQCGPTSQYSFSNGGTATQDLGQQPAGSYTLTVGICNRTDGVGSGATYTISLGSCSQSALNSTLPQGVSTVMLTCQFSAGDMVVSLGCSGAQCNFASVSVAPTVFVFTLSNCGQSTCTFTFPMQSPPQCTAADGMCSLVIQVNPPTCGAAFPSSTCTSVEIDIIKTMSLPTPQIVTIPVVKATSP